MFSVTNALLIDSELQDLSIDERRERWKWGRCPEAVSNAKTMEANLLATITESKELTLYKKYALKKNVYVITLKLLGTCKELSGPMTPDSVEKLNELNEKQLLSEIGYLRATIAPDIRQKRRDTGYKMETFSLTQLRNSIKNTYQRSM